MRSGDGVIVLRTLRLATERNNRIRRSLLNDVFGDEDLSAVVSRAIEDEYAPLYSDLGGEQVVGSFQDFLKWILDNQDTIIAFIQKIIALFNPPAP